MLRMQRRIRSKTLLIFTLSAIWAALTGFAQEAIANPPVPPLPQYFLMDEPQILAPIERKALETILIEHADTTGQQILVGIFNGPEGEDPAQRTHEIFEDWLDNRGQDDGVLLTVYMQGPKGGIESGYGVQIPPETGEHAIIRDDLLPELKAGHAFRALGLSLLDLLRALESPLIESGRAEQLLQEGGLEGSLTPVKYRFGPGGWLGFVLMGALILGGVLNNGLAAEAHFTSEGWYRPNPWKLLSLEALRQARNKTPTPTGGIDGHW